MPAGGFCLHGGPRTRGRRQRKARTTRRLQQQCLLRSAKRVAERERRRQTTHRRGTWLACGTRNKKRPCGRVDGCTAKRHWTLASAREPFFSSFLCRVSCSDVYLLVSLAWTCSFLSLARASPFLSLPHFPHRVAVVRAAMGTCSAACVSLAAELEIHPVLLFPARAGSNFRMR